MKIKQFFGEIGYLNSYSPNQAKAYVITKRSDLVNRVIPHFNNYPLIGNKLYHFNIWSEIVTLMDSGAHLTPQGLAKIRDLNKSLNKQTIKEE